MDYYRLVDLLRWPVVFLIVAVIFLLSQWSKIGTLIGRIREISHSRIQLGDIPHQQDLRGGDKRSLADQFLRDIEEGRLTRSIDLIQIKRIEEFVKSELEKRKLGASVEAIDVLIRQLAIAWSAYVFEFVYAQIYGSQLSLLSYLNPLPQGETKERIKSLFYDPIAQLYPDQYKGYPFDNYMAYLASMNLIVLDSNRYKITEFGRFFLSYLMKEGKFFNKAF